MTTLKEKAECMWRYADIINYRSMTTLKEIQKKTFFQILHKRRVKNFQ